MGENSKTAKALAISDAVISTWQGANRILAAGSNSFGPGVIGVALMYSAMAGEIATGIANVKNILSEKSDGSSASSAVSSTVSTLSTAQVTPLLDENQNNIPTPMYDVNGNNPLKVYVVEADITETQRKVKVSESESSF